MLRPVRDRHHYCFHPTARTAEQGGRRGVRLPRAGVRADDDRGRLPGQNIKHRPRRRIQLLTGLDQAQCRHGEMMLLLGDLTENSPSAVDPATQARTAECRG